MQRALLAQLDALARDERSDLCVSKSHMLTSQEMLSETVNRVEPSLMMDWNTMICAWLSLLCCQTHAYLTEKVCDLQAWPSGLLWIMRLLVVLYLAPR